jgi:hypothetical protein
MCSYRAESTSSWIFLPTLSTPWVCRTPPPCVPTLYFYACNTMTECRPRTQDCRSCCCCRRHRISRRWGTYLKKRRWHRHVNTVYCLPFGFLSALWQKRSTTRTNIIGN